MSANAFIAPLFAIAGALIGCGSWAIAGRLTRGARAGAAPPRALLLLACVAGGALLGIAALRSGSSVPQVAVVALLATPLLITLLTDLLARLVFPAILVPAILVALAVAASGPPGLPAALISGAAAGVVAGLLVLLSRSLWSDTGETPLGSGDVLIAATAGTILGPEQTAPALFAGMVIAALVAALLLLTRRVRRDEAIPYGAFLCASTLISLAN